MEKVTFGMENHWWNKTVLLSERELTAMAGGTPRDGGLLAKREGVYICPSFFSGHIVGQTSF